VTLRKRGRGISRARAAGERCCVVVVGGARAGEGTAWARRDWRAWSRLIVVASARSAVGRQGKSARPGGVGQGLAEIGCHGWHEIREGRDSGQDGAAGKGACLLPCACVRGIDRTVHQKRLWTPTVVS
jgi:hypothetical protein